MQRRDQDALIRIRIAAINQEQAFVQNTVQQEAFKAEDGRMAMYQKEFEGKGGFAGADPEGRRRVSSEFPLYPFILFPLAWIETSIGTMSNIPYRELCMAKHHVFFMQKAAPPARCHSCNRAETPEWRRGPDGARTLCNACGLQYAKLTRNTVNDAAHPGRCRSCNRAKTPEWRRGPDGARTLCNACGLQYAKLTRRTDNKMSCQGQNLKPKSTLDYASKVNH
jgi:hypothetical protein